MEGKEAKTPIESDFVVDIFGHNFPFKSEKVLCCVLFLGKRKLHEKMEGYFLGEKRPPNEEKIYDVMCA